MRSLRWVVAAILVGVVALGAVGHRPREVRVTYQTRIRRLPQHAETIDVWIPLAKTTGEQRILRRQIRTSVPYAIAQDPEYGNDILHLSLQPPLPEALAVSIDYHARLGQGDEAAADPPAPADELAREITPRGLVIVDDEVRARAVRATAGRTTPRDKARGLYEAVIQQMQYDKTVPGWGRGDTRRACLLGKGNCTDFHSLFISMARAERIPARFKIGVVIPRAPSGIVPGYHCWAEFYEASHGWVPVDASEAWKHPELADYYFGARDPSRFLISVGRDIQLVPRQQGDPVNIFFSPYVEVNGQAFSEVGVEVRFADLQQGRAT